MDRPAVDAAVSPVAGGSHRRKGPLRRPRLTFAVTVVALTWAVQLTFLALGWPLFPALAIELLILLVTATAITAMVCGRSGVRALYAGVIRWRFSAVWYAVVLGLVPFVTVLVASVVGTVGSPSSGWGEELLQYLFLTIVFGALLGNMWEELAWTAFFQAGLAERHGVLRAALITAVPFGLIHLPLAFEEDGLTGTLPTDLLVTWGLLLVVAPFFRYLIGLVHAHTGRSLLAVAVLHGSFNASGSMTLATGGWEYIAGTVLATPLVALLLARRRSIG